MRITLWLLFTFASFNTFIQTQQPDWLPVIASILIILVTLVLIIIQYLHVQSIKSNDDKYSSLIEQEKEISQDKAKHLAKVSHDLRTPLHGINGLIEVIEKETVSPKIQRYLDQIRVSSRALMTVISDAIDLSNNSPNGMSLRLEPFRLLEVCENVVRIFTQSAQSKNIELQLHFDSRLIELGVKSDSQRLYQVLSNLIGNAFKFTDHGNVSVWVIFRQENAEELSVRFLVSDTGVGIPEKDLAAVFEPFYQVNSSQNSRARGSGLGLNISKEIVEMMGGKIQAKSKENFGTQLFFDLTFKKVRLKGIPRFTAEHKHKTIIKLVSSKGTATESIRSLFSNWNINVQQYDSTQSLLSENHSEQTDLLIIDFAELGTLQESNELKDALRAKANCVLLDNNQYKEFADWHVLYKPILPSELIQIAVRSDVLRASYTLSEYPIDYSTLMLTYATTNPISHLIVDDNEINKVVLHESLKQLGFSDFDFASNGKEAIHKAAERHFDVIWMDIHMPIMSGVEASKIIKDSKSTAVIVAITASVDDELISECRKVTDLVLSKPLSPSEIAENLYQMFVSKSIDQAEKQKLAQKLEDIATQCSFANPINILVASENEKLISSLLQIFNTTQAFKMMFVDKAADIPEILTVESFQLLLIDYELPRLSIPLLFNEFTAKRIVIPICVLTDTVFKQPTVWQRTCRTIPLLPSSNQVCELLEATFVNDIHSAKQMRANTPTQKSNHYE
ncbi:response regulator [Glaciecola sp. MH2013]|uniref:ATP-binding protein n=1 Tax=Glaciecola sp. MH2013 TaxID=2785524 RepID=UPI00189DD205|nr:ATP-binding protein [Glaciecola sp. MH2013]MBF7073553.1 response regulator [Glaciecola sp. MH2013]